MCLCQCPIAFLIMTLEYNLESSMAIFLEYFCSGLLLSIRGLLCFHMNSNIVFMNNGIGFLIEDALSMQISFDRTIIFTLLILLIHFPPSSALVDFLHQSCQGQCLSALYEFRHRWKEGITIEELPPSHWIVGKTVGSLPDWWLMWEGPAHYEYATLRLVVLGVGDHRLGKPWRTSQ